MRPEALLGAPDDRLADEDEALLARVLHRLAHQQLGLLLLRPRLGMAVVARQEEAPVPRGQRRGTVDRCNSQLRELIIS